MEQNKCCCGEKQTIRSEEQKKSLLNRLKRIEGQVRGIQAMIERDSTAMTYSFSPQLSARQ